MQNPLVQIASSIFGKDSLAEIPREDLHLLTVKYPYSAPLHLIYARRLRDMGDSRYAEAVGKAAIHYSNPHWLQHQLTTPLAEDVYTSEEAAPDAVEELMTEVEGENREMMAEPSEKPSLEAATESEGTSAGFRLDVEEEAPIADITVEKAASLNPAVQESSDTAEPTALTSPSINPEEYKIHITEDLSIQEERTEGTNAQPLLDDQTGEHNPVEIQISQVTREPDSEQSPKDADVDGETLPRVSGFHDEHEGPTASQSVEWIDDVTLEASETLLTISDNDPINTENPDPEAVVATTAADAEPTEASSLITELFGDQEGPADSTSAEGTAEPLEATEAVTTILDEAPIDQEALDPDSVVPSEIAIEEHQDTIQIPVIAAEAEAQEKSLPDEITAEPGHTTEVREDDTASSIPDIDEGEQMGMDELSDQTEVNIPLPEWNSVNEVNEPSLAKEPITETMPEFLQVQDTQTPDDEAASMVAEPVTESLASLPADDDADALTSAATEEVAPEIEDTQTFDISAKVPQAEENVFPLQEPILPSAEPAVSMTDSEVEASIDHVEEPQASILTDLLDPSQETATAEIQKREDGDSSQTAGTGLIHVSMPEEEEPLQEHVHTEDIGVAVAEYDDPESAESSLEDEDEFSGDDGQAPLSIQLTPHTWTPSAEDDFELPIEPLHVTDYFASQGIEVSSELDIPGNNQGERSFTGWLRTMKRIQPDGSGGVGLSDREESLIRAEAEASNLEEDVVTESMAEVYARQGLLRKSIAVYEKLSLLDPDRSSTFAARIHQLKALLT